MNIIKPPDSIAKARGFKIFLAGSIEMGKAEDWQSKIINSLSSLHKELTIYNPRRDDWDSSWDQQISNDNFYEQVRWELQALDDSNLIVMYYDPNTTSPISLLELGLYANSKKLIICCPDGFYRKGNIDIVCHKYNIPMLDDFNTFVDYIRNMIVY